MPEASATSFTADQFVSELMAGWVVQDFRRALRWAAADEGCDLEAVRVRGGCVRFTLIPPPGHHPTTKTKMRARLHRLFKHTGFRVPDRYLHLRVGRRRRAIAVLAAPRIP